MSIQTDQQLQSFSTQQIEELVLSLTDAQARGDVGALEALLSDDFKLVGPLGFVVPKQQWLDQFDSGPLQISVLDWDELDVRTHGYAQVAIVIGRLKQSARYAGRPADGIFRVTVIAIRAGDRWLVAGLHYSPVAAPGGAPGR
ncbi:MAG: nuclear transport factor 2 family protein [Solirubrobacteraceae bacterium]